MPDQPTFVVNDRRKFTSEGELRHDRPAEPAVTSASSTAETAQPTPAGPRLVENEPAEPAGMTAEMADLPESQALGALEPGEPRTEKGREQPKTDYDADPDSLASLPYDDSLPPGPTPEQADEAARAYAATVDRLDTAMRAANPGGERTPAMSFDRLIQSLYTQALLLLGGGAEPGETPRVDILGARQTIDMLAVIEEKTRSDRSESEGKLLETALFDLHMGFLEITQALARQAAQRAPGPGTPGAMPMGPGGPRIVR